MKKRKRPQLVCLDPSLAVQSQKAEADINTIVRNFGITGRMPSAVRLPSFGDYSQVSDYRSALEAVRQAEASFLEVSANVRARFHNDPQAFMEFCENPGNLPQLREWGLAPPAQAAAPANPPSEP